MTTIRHHFVLYLFDEAPELSTALNNLQRLCQRHVPDMYEVKVVHLVEDPTLAERENIYATPTLERTAPSPHIRILGDLSDTENVLQRLGFFAGEGTGS